MPKSKCSSVISLKKKLWRKSYRTRATNMLAAYSTLQTPEVIAWEKASTAACKGSPSLAGARFSHGDEQGPDDSDDQEGRARTFNQRELIGLLHLDMPGEPSRCYDRWQKIGQVGRPWRAKV